MPGAVQDVITPANYCCEDRLRGFSVARGRILAFSIDLLRRHITLSHYRASVWCSTLVLVLVLATLSSKYYKYSVPASSAPVERVFSHGGLIMTPTVPEWLTRPASLKIGRLHKHKKSRFEHTHIFMDASATGRLEWCTAVCSLVSIAISLFLFIIFVNVVLSQRWGVVCGLRLFKCL